MIIEKNQRYETIPLENLIDLVIGGDWGKDETFEDEEFSLAYCIRGAEFKNWQEDRGQTASIRKLKNRSIETRKLQYGDILLEISGGGPEQPVGRTVLIENQTLQRMSKLPIVCTNFLRLVRVTDSLNKKYINQYLEFFYKSGEVAKYQAGSNNLRNLKFNDYKLIEIPIAPLPEQKAIVAKIEQLFSELDNGIANLKTASAKLKIYRQAVLKKAFEGELTKKWREKQTNLPTADEALKEIDNEKYSLGYEIKNRVNSWSYYPIGNLCEFQQGMQIAKSSRLKQEEENTLPILRIKNYRDGFKTDVEHIRIDKNSLIAEENDLIVTRTGESRGDILTGFRGVFHNNTFRINYDKNIFTRKYLLHYLTFSEVQNYIKFVSGRTGQPDLTHRNFGPCPVIIPSILEQNQIVQEIESRLSVCDKIEETIETSLAKSEALRQSILKKAFEGKLLSEQELENIKNHPEYESAETLLENIKRERNK